MLPPSENFVLAKPTILLMYMYFVKEGSFTPPPNIIINLYAISWTQSNNWVSVTNSISNSPSSPPSPSSLSVSLLPDLKYVCILSAHSNNSSMSVTNLRLSRLSTRLNHRTLWRHLRLSGQGYPDPSDTGWFRTRAPPDTGPGRLFAVKAMRCSH